jgi:hypothetical protein
MLNGLQIIIHLPILQIVLPASVMFFFQLIIPFAMFDILDFLGLAERLFDFNYD